MKGSKKALISTVAVIGLSVASISMVSAYGGNSGYGCCDRGGYGDRQQKQGQMMQKGKSGRGMGGNMGQRIEEKLDRIKYKLRITEKQEPAWNEFTDTVANKAATMRDRMQQRGTQQPVSERVKRMRDGAEQMTKMADAIDKMYKTLTPEQQKIADQINPRGMRGF
jgi:periplasmic protein CpxP/Spy